MFQNMSIAKRLSLGFSILTLLLLLTNVFALWRLNAITTDLHLISDDKVPKMVNAFESLVRNQRIQQIMGELFFAEDKAGRDAVIASSETIRAENKKALEILSATIYTEDAKALLANILQTRSAIFPSYQATMRLIESDPDAARVVMQKEFSPAMNALSRSMNEMVILMQKHVDSATKDANGRFEEGRTTLISMTIVSIVLAAFLSLWLIRSVTRPLSHIQNIVMDTRNTNDFTKEAHEGRNDETGQTARAFNALLLTLREALTEVKASVSALSDASEVLMNNSESSAKGSLITSSSASSISSAVEQMSLSIATVSKNAKEASLLAEKAGALSESGAKIIGEATDEMKKINGSIEEVSFAMSALGEESQKISHIVHLIREVSDQTNLLALNAAIEAARAGEAGRGFAVVADEVRKLAERTSLATEEISSVIETILSRTQSAISLMASSVEQVKHGQTLAQNAGISIIEIKEAASQVEMVVGDIAKGICEQSETAQSVSEQLESVAKAAEDNNKIAGETSMAANTLGQLAKKMRAVTDRFKIA